MSVDLGDVSRETLDRLRAFEALVRKWTRKINLVSKASVDDVWSRHILDSLQIYRMGPKEFSHWLDIGSGGGFPGIVVAIMAHGSGAKVTMIESDARKCAFLRAALREVGVSGDVVTARIEEVAPMKADVLSARALADLSTLMTYAERHLSADGAALFAKGATWQQEVAAARSQWNFDLEAVKSDLVAESAILKISGASRV